MQFAPISDDQLKAVPNLRENAVALRARVHALVASLHRYFDHEQVKVGLGVEFRMVNDGTRALADIDTPAGRGRLIHAWGADTGGITAIVVVEKATFDDRDRIVWKPVWGIDVPRFEDPYAGIGVDCLRIPLNDPFGDRLNRAIYEAGSAIVAAVVTR